VQPDIDTWIAGLGSLPLLAQPGERWLYNTSAQVLGVLAERAAGQPLGEVFRTRLFEPLGMRDTGFWTAETNRVATAYRATPEGLVGYDDPDGTWARPHPFSDAAAGLVSTVDDLWAFARMLLRGGGPVLSPNAVRAMTTDQLTPAQKSHGGLAFDVAGAASWGFGLAINADGSFGWDGGLGTSWLVDPTNDLTVIVLTQRMFDSPQTPAVHTDIQAAAYSALT
jgi:CubicO group peptidase (beta-lactamase class C family)